MKTLLTLILILMSVITLFAQNIVQNSDKGYSIVADTYKAEISNDTGLLNSLRVNDEEFIDDAALPPKGSFCYSNTILTANKVEKNNNIITSTTSGTIVTYNFMPNKIDITTENLLDIDANYTIVLNLLIHSAKSDKGYYKFPINLDEENFTLYKNNAAIKTSGLGRYWGPWNGRQLLSLILGPKAKRYLSIEPVTLNKNNKDDLIVYSPVEYQVFQRESKTNGHILFSGRLNKTFDKVLYKIEGKDLNGKVIESKWRDLAISKNNTFNQKIPCNAGGWYKCQIKLIKNKEEKIITINKVGIGEIIIGAGQSNSTNCGQIPTKQESGMVASTDGVEWKYADDPQIGHNDGSGSGSLYPALGDALYKEFKVPIGVAATGRGATSVNQWYIGGELYNWFMTRVYQFGDNGFRCVIWHQGESDVNNSTKNYYVKLSDIILKSQEDAKWYFPWFVAKVSYISKNNSSFNSTRDAQQKLWDNNIALQGPDSDTITGSDRDSSDIHLSPSGLKKLGQMYADCIIPYIHKQID